MNYLYRFAPLLVVWPAAAFFGRAAVAGTQKVSATSGIPWDSAFEDRSGSTPLHFVASYQDSHGESHRLEEWRVDTRHLRRLTDNRIDLHADSSGNPLAGQPTDYVWQVLDLQKRVANRISSAGMLHLGMLYSYYSMAHLLTRPAGTFTVRETQAPAGAQTQVVQRSDAWQNSCTWWQIDAPGQLSTRVCWISRYGIPAEIWSQSAHGWRQNFLLRSVDTAPIAHSTFLTSTAGFQVRDVDSMQQDD